MKTLQRFTLLLVICLTAVSANSNNIRSAVVDVDKFGNSSSSWWHALDGIPFLIEKRSTRKLSKSKINKRVLATGEDIQGQPFSLFDSISMHRSLAFGDYVDPTFQCPATTTCRVVCVAAAEDCPQDSQCPDDGNEYELCSDGTCANINANEACDAEAESPCGCEALPFACAKQIDLYPVCTEERFQSYYDAETECIEAQVEALPQVDFTGPWFVACYVGLSAVTVIMLIWCAWNQRLSPVEGSTVPLECAKKDKSLVNASTSIDQEAGAAAAGTAVLISTSIETDSVWTQTGYKTTVVGMSVYVLVILTHIIIQFLLLALTVEYYVQQESATVYFFGKQVFYDELQVLKAFEIVWMAGVVWCFFLKYPVSIHSLFLRRCLPNESGYVAVSAPVQNVDTHYQTKWIVKLLSSMESVFRRVLSFLYSDVSHHPAIGSRMKVTLCKVREDKKTGSRYFYFRMRRYILDETEKKFIPGRWNANEEPTIGEWLDKSCMHQGLSHEEASKRLAIVGPNVLDLKKPTIIQSILNEFSKPFYLYQNFMVWTWAPYWYYYMAIVNTVVRVTGGLVVAIFQYISDKSLYELMVMEGTVEVFRGGEMMVLNQIDVVPGDIVRLVPSVAYFDMALLQSSHLLVDESSLTGEVNPIAKVPLDPAKNDLRYDPKVNKLSTIAAGTTILECGEEAGLNGDLAIVTQTGSFTAKGELLSDVLSYERHKFKFDTEVKLVLAILAVEAIVLLAIVFSLIEDNWEYSWFYAMFVVGTVLPPLLPTVFVVSVGISCKRLQNNRITCTDSQSVLVAGKVKKAFFDKTGTLTKQGLDFMGVDAGDESETNSLAINRGLATCQTLQLSNKNELIGSAVDRSMVASVTSSVSFADQNRVIFEGETINYLKRFEFDHHRMLQSVIIRHKEEVIVYAKGSPEAIRKICAPSSLLANFDETAAEAARNGIYQLAIATSSFRCDKDISDVKREDIETNLNFLGFISFQNKMKEDTPVVVAELRDGGVDCAMITGDNVLTGVYIARKSGLIDADKNVVLGRMNNEGSIEWVNASNDSPTLAPPPSIEAFSVMNALALTGEAWNYLLEKDPESAFQYAKYTSVFGRATPNDKVSIVSVFVELGDITLMCGDGGNDCGALKAAHVGIALSDAEASVVAPFTSLDKKITSVTEVLREGRCALASALASYKYMIMYGQVESINQVANAYFSITFSEWCWVFMDGIWSLTMAFSLPLAKAAKKLSKNRPTASILGPHTLSSACGVLGINFLFLVFALVALMKQDWYQCRKWDSTDVSNVLTLGDNYETSVIFIVTGYQYISSAAAYNFGYTYRGNWFSNYIFVFLFTLWTAFQFGATLSASKFSCIWRLNCDNDNAVRSVTSSEPSPISNPFNTTVMPMSFRGLLVTLMIINLILNCAWDYFIVNKALPVARKKKGVIQGESQRGDLYEPPPVA